MNVGTLSQAPYPPEAFKFVRDGLERAARKLHGPMTPAQFIISQYLVSEQVDLDELTRRLAQGELDPTVEAALQQCPDSTCLNRNVSGENLCWVLRDLAWDRWGMMAGTVLRHWNIQRTEDFGNLVFAMVEQGVMQKEPHDSPENFKSVFAFRDALDKGYRIVPTDPPED